MHDLVSGPKDVQQVHDQPAGSAADPDERMLSNEQLERAEAEGKSKAS